MRYILLTAILAAVLANAAAAADKPEIFSDKTGAIRGYDPVAYFTLGEPIQGKPHLSYRWKGADWYFASQAHLELFRDNPERYAPRYGGWCAYAMSRGKYASVAPHAWAIHEGRLYLNFSKGIRRAWSEAIPTHIASANRHWRRLRGRSEP